jgi:hypothetical protein
MMLNMIGAPLKYIAFLALSFFFVACGADREATTAEVSSVSLPDPEYVFACTPAESSDAQFQSIRVSVRNGAAAMVVDRFDSSETFATADSLISTLSDSGASVSWSTGASFAVHRERGRIFAGTVTLAGESVATRCVRIVTSDRDADEFSLYCAPSAPMPAAAATTMPRELLLTYEEGELEMFVNPTGAIEIFDLELASGVEVNAGLVRADWAFHGTSFRATATGPDRFEGVLNYRGLSTHRFVCHRI